MQRLMNPKKKSIIENDLILVHIENRPAFFARVESISPDIKSGWWRVKLLMLQVPLAATTWFLDNEQIRGAEFTMGGIPIRIEKIVVPSTEQQKRKQPAPSIEPKTNENQKARILSLMPPNKKE